MPLANGAAQSGVAFVDHAVVVLIVPLLLILVFCVVDAVGRLLARTWRGRNQSSGSGIVAAACRSGGVRFSGAQTRE